MALFTEAFTAANGTDVDSLTGWDEHPLRTTGQLLIQTNRAYCAADDALVYNTATPASADYSVEATLYVASAVTTGGRRNGPVGRMDTTAETYYELLYLQQEGRWRLSRVTAGQLLELGSYTQALTPASSYVAKIEMVGTVINAYVDGALRIGVDDTAAPILAKGKAGYKAGGLAVTTTTGIHVDAATATDAAAPDQSITYVGVGAAATVATTGTVSPALPAGLAVDDLMIAVGWQKSGSGSISVPSGWTSVINPAGAGKSRILTRFYQTGDAAPGINIDSNATGGIAQVAAFRNVDKTTAVDVLGTVATANAATNIGPIPGLTPSVAGALVVVYGGRWVDWTSVATLSGDSLTWNEIAEPDSASTPQIGFVWDYAIFAGAPTAVTSKTFTVTGGTGNWHGYMLAFRPATTVAPPATNPTKVKIAGVFVTKVAKRKASGTFATKPMKAMSDHPPPPPIIVDPTTYTLTPVTSIASARPLTYTAAPPTYFIFPARDTASARPLTYLFHPPPGQSGMRVSMWEAVTPLQNVSEATLDTLHSYGVDGFHISCSYMPGMGGGITTFANYVEFAKDFANSHPQFRCTMGVHLNNLVKNLTPCANLYDDTTWANTIIPNFQQIAHAVDDSALVGLSLDGEGYQGSAVNWVFNGAGASWPTFTFSYQGVSRTEAEVRAKMKVRARSLADAVTAITGPIDIYEYFLYLPGSAKELISLTVDPKDYRNYVSEDWIDGWTSNSQVTFYHFDAAYYKPGRADGRFSNGYDGAYAYDHANYNANPKLGKSNSFHCPFIWPGPGPLARAQAAAGKPVTASDRQFTAAEVTLQLQKARQYTQGGEFGLYDQGWLNPASNYTPISAALQSAST